MVSLRFRSKERPVFFLSKKYWTKCFHSNAVKAYNVVEFSKNLYPRFLKRPLPLSNLIIFYVVGWDIFTIMRTFFMFFIWGSRIFKEFFLNRMYLREFTFNKLYFLFTIKINSLNFKQYKWIFMNYNYYKIIFFNSKNNYIEAESSYNKQNIIYKLWKNRRI